MDDIAIPVTKPAADTTWEASYLLQTADLSTPRIQVIFPGRWLIVGAYASVVSEGGVLVNATIDDILCRLDVDNKDTYTANGRVSQNGADTQLVTLASLDTRYRDWMLELKSDKPVLGISYTWKRGIGVYNPATIALSLFVKER